MGNNIEKKYGFWNAIELSDPNLQLKNAIKRIKECETVLLKVENCVINDRFQVLLLKISKYREKYMKKEVKAEKYEA